jgi:hypothetical protein
MSIIGRYVLCPYSLTVGPFQNPVPKFVYEDVTMHLNHLRRLLEPKRPLKQIDYAKVSYFLMVMENSIDGFFGTG